MKYLFGPVPSRRLGLSLGVDIVPMKTCTLSCIYCQIGATPITTVERREYVPADEVLRELEEFFRSGGKTDWVTFSGSGEPTLNSGIGSMIRAVKQITKTPVCVITNGTMLSDPAVRRDILDADTVMPSLDSAVEETFDRVCRPYAGLSLTRIIDGLAAFREEFKGALWLEILFVEGLNDSDREVGALKEAVKRIRPDSIHLNTVVRPPAESAARPVTMDRLMAIREVFGNKAEIIASFRGATGKSTLPLEDAIREYLKRRPGSTDDIAASLGFDTEETGRELDALSAKGEITRREHFGKEYWEFTGGTHD